MNELWRFEELTELGIVRNRTQLRRMQKALGFPVGFMLTKNARVWDRDEVEAWLEGRRSLGRAA